MPAQRTESSGFTRLKAASLKFCPAKSDSLVKGPSADFSNFQNSSERQSLAILQNYSPIESGIVILLSVCSPPAILFAVTFFIISAVNGVAFSRMRAHILKEIIKSKPPFAYCNSPASVMGVFFMLRIKAAHFHAVPSLILLGTSAPGIAMAQFNFGAMLNSAFSSVATTAFDILCGKPTRRDNFFAPTFTLTSPHSLVLN